MLYREIIAVSSEDNETRTRVNTLCGQKEGFLNSDSVVAALFYIFRYICLFYIYICIYILIFT
jgi:hypothetical protein